MLKYILVNRNTMAGGKIDPFGFAEDPALCNKVKPNVPIFVNRKLI